MALRSDDSVSFGFLHEKICYGKFTNLEKESEFKNQKYFAILSSGLQ